jgi:hypothetical protein
MKFKPRFKEEATNQQIPQKRNSQSEKSKVTGPKSIWVHQQYSIGSQLLTVPS